MKNFKLFNEAEREAGYKMPKHVADAQKKFDTQSKQKKPAQAGTLAAKRNMKKEEVEQGVAEGFGGYVGRKLQVKTTKGKPNPKNAPKWASALGQTPQGAWHWLEKDGPVETPDSDRYFPLSGKTEFTGFVSKYEGTQGVAEGGFFDPDKPKIGDMVQHKYNKSVGKVKKIGTQGNEIWIYFKDNRTGDMIFGQWKKHVFPIKNKGVAEEVEQIDELTHMKSYKMDHLLKLIKDGEWEAYSDVKPRRHVTLTRLKDKKKVTVFVEEVMLGEVTAAQAAKILGGPVKKIPKGPPGKHPQGYRMARNAARRAMKAVMKKEETEGLEEMEKKPKEIRDMSTSALKQFWDRHKDETYPAPILAAYLRRIVIELRRRNALKKESVDLQESHFKVGDKVECIRSGMNGIVTKVDPAGKGKYYTVKRSDGKEMKHAANELKKVMKEAKKPNAAAKARRDAMRGIKGDKDLAFKGDDDDVKASDDDVKAASKNPVMQLRRISDLDGKGDMEFKNGKKGKVTSAEAKALLKVFDTLRMPKEKENFQNAVGKSLEDLKKVLRSPPKPSVPFKQKIKGSRYMTGFKWDNED